MPVLSPWAEALLKDDPGPVRLLAGPPPPPITAGGGPIGPHADLASLSAMMPRPAASPDVSTLAAIQSALEALRDARRGPPGAQAGIGGDAHTAGDDDTTGTAPGGYSPRVSPRDDVPPGSIDRLSARLDGYVPPRPGDPRVPPEGGDIPAGFDMAGYKRFVSKLESGGDYNVYNGMGSGAFGRYQFMPDTIRGLGIDPREFRRPEVQEAAMEALTRQNYAYLVNKVKINPDPVSLYLAHWMGPRGAELILTSNPMVRMEALFGPEVIRQNGLAGSTVNDVLRRLYGKAERRTQ